MSDQGESAPAAAQPKAAPDTEKKTLTNKELKELKKKEKAAKRAAQKEAAGISPEQQEQMAQQKMEKKKQQLATNTGIKKQLSQAVVKDQSMKIPALFSHLETREQRNASSPTVSHIVHPSILSLSLRFSNHEIVGSTARLRSMLEVFKMVIDDYKTPENTTLTRHLTGHLSHQIEYLKSSRPLSIAMGNAIRWLKQEISLISIDTPELEAKQILSARIDTFINEKLHYSDQAIVQSASQHISNGSTVLTFGHSEVLLKLFQYCATEQNKSFNLVIVDSRPLFEGKRLLTELANTTQKAETPNGEPDAELESSSIISRRSAPASPITKENIKVNYCLINLLLSTIFEDVDCVFLGAHAMLSNGYMYSRVGTAMVAMMAHKRNIPVLTCCESIKFSERVQLDSVTTNELADPEDLIKNANLKQPPQQTSLALKQFLKEVEQKEHDKKAKTGKKEKEPVKSHLMGDESLLADWKSIPSLNLLNIMYDLTPPSYINKVVTELGSLPPLSVPVILREYKSG